MIVCQRMSVSTRAVLAAVATVAAGSVASENCSNPTLNVLLMTYNRINSANAVVWQLRRAMGRDVRGVRLVVSQNHAKGDNYSTSLSMLLAAEHGVAFCAIEHVLTPMLQNERSLGTVGSKRNAQNNLLGGLRALFGTAPDSIMQARAGRRLSTPSRAREPPSAATLARRLQPQFALILEDDVSLSPDALEYFAYAGEPVVVARRGYLHLHWVFYRPATTRAASVMAASSSINFATARALFRPSIVVGVDDLATVAALRSRVRLGGATTA